MINSTALYAFDFTWILAHFSTRAWLWQNNTRLNDCTHKKSFCLLHTVAIILLQSIRYSYWMSFPHVLLQLSFLICGDNLHFFAWVFFLCTSCSWHIFHSSRVRILGGDWILVKFTCPQMIIFCTWSSVQHCHSGLVSLKLLSHFLSLSLFLSLWIFLHLFPSLSLVIYHSTGGLAWPSSLFCLDDSEGQWQSGALVGARVCESVSFHWECCALMSGEVMWSMCDWRGFPPHKVSASRRGVYIVWIYMCVCVQSVEFDRTKQVKTTRCVCFNVSSWLVPQACHSQETMHLETAGRSHNQIFTHLNWAAVEWHRCHDTLVSIRRWLISLKSWNAPPPPIKPF